MTPTVSIVIPCFNAERYLAATLDSVLNQTNAPMEVIVVDDHSTDNSRAIAGNYRPGVTLLDNPGKGASAARNTGTRHARGEFIQYVDADDLLESHAIESRVASLIDRQADVAISDWQNLCLVDSDWIGKEIKTGRLPDGPESAYLKIFNGFWAPPAAILYRQSLVQRLPEWSESLPVIQDARFLFEAAYAKGSFVHLEGIGAYYRQHASESLSTRSASAFSRDVLTNSREIEQRWTKDGLATEQHHRMALSNAYASGSRTTFPLDKDLFISNCTELARFPEHQCSRYLRMAMFLNRLAGYSIARRVMKILKE